MSELATHLIAYVDSHTRLNGSHTHFTHEINLPARNTFDSVCILQASIPKSFYLIARDYNTFQLSEPTGVPVTVSIPIGNYSRKALAQTLSTVLTEASPSQLYNYTVTFPSGSSGADTGKYTFTITRIDLAPLDPNLAFSISFFDAYQPCEALGFERNSENDFEAGVLESTNVCRLQAKSTIFIKSNCVDNGGTAVLQAIFGADPDFSVINFQVGNAGGISANRKELLVTNSNSFIFVITDEDGVQIDTNGLSVNFSMLLWDSRKYSFYSAAK
jgi:hypothetical protein